MRGRTPSYALVRIKNILNGSKRTAEMMAVSLLGI
jgi:hypothetical protein